MRDLRRHGLRIQKRPGAGRGHPFAWCFRAILPSLVGYHWIVQRGAFGAVPEEWVAASEYDEVSDRYASGPLERLDALHLDGTADHEYFGPGLLPRFAPAVCEDWNELYGLPEPVASLRDWVAGRDGDDRLEHLARTVVVCFLNVDGAYWELHARGAELIEAVRSDMAGESEVMVTAARLEDSHAL